MSTIRPLYDRIAFIRDDVKEVSEGGILVPGGVDEEPDFGTVIAVGTGACLPDGTIRPMTVKPGDRIIVSKGTGSEVDLDGQKIVIVSEPEIVGVMS